MEERKVRLGDCFGFEGFSFGPIIWGRKLEIWPERLVKIVRTLAHAHTRTHWLGGADE